RSLDTDPYDLHTFVYLEREINFMKKDFLEFKNDNEFIRSNEKSKTRWAVNILRKHLCKILDDTKELKHGVDMMKKNPLPCLNIHHTSLLEQAEETLVMEESFSSPPVQSLTQQHSREAALPQGPVARIQPVVQAREAQQNKRTPFKEMEANNQQAAVAARVNKMLSEIVDMSDCEIPPAKRRKLIGRARFSVDV
ncbi:hypothetical protein BGZ95_007196, partial [Linnemannia exigua]